MTSNITAQLNVLCAKIKRLNKKVNNFTAFLEGNTIFVDSVYGNDATGEANNPAKPFKTIYAAANFTTKSLNNVLIYIRPGEYNNEENLAIPNKTLYWYFENGTTVTGKDILWNVINGENYIFGEAIFKSLGESVIKITGNENPIFHLSAQSIINDYGACIQIIDSAPDCIIDVENSIISNVLIDVNAPDPNIELLNINKVVIYSNSVNDIIINAEKIEHNGGGINVLASGFININASIISTTGPTSILHNENTTLNINSNSIISNGINFINGPLNRINEGCIVSILGTNNINSNLIQAKGNEIRAGNALNITGGLMNILSNKIINNASNNEQLSALYIGGGTLSCQSNQIISESSAVINIEGGIANINTDIIDNRLIPFPVAAIDMNDGELKLNIGEVLCANNFEFIIHRGGIIIGDIEKALFNGNSIFYVAEPSTASITTTFNLDNITTDNGNIFNIVGNNTNSVSLNVNANNLISNGGNLLVVNTNIQTLSVINLDILSYTTGAGNGIILVSGNTISRFNIENLNTNNGTAINIDTGNIISNVSANIGQLTASSDNGILIFGNANPFNFDLNIQEYFSFSNQSAIYISAIPPPDIRGILQITINKLIASAYLLITDTDTGDNIGDYNMSVTINFGRSSTTGDMIQIENRNTINFTFNSNEHLIGENAGYLFRQLIGTSNINLNQITNNGDSGIGLSLNEGIINGQVQIINSRSRSIDITSISALNLKVQKINHFGNNSSAINISDGSAYLNIDTIESQITGADAMIFILTNQNIDFYCNKITGNLLQQDSNIFYVNGSAIYNLNVGNITTTGYILNNSASGPINFNVENINITSLQAVGEPSDLFTIGNGNTAKNIYNINKFIYGLPIVRFANPVVFNFSGGNNIINLKYFESLNHTGVLTFFLNDTTTNIISNEIIVNFQFLSSSTSTITLDINKISHLSNLAYLMTINSGTLNFDIDLAIGVDSNFMNIGGGNPSIYGNINQIRDFLNLFDILTIFDYSVEIGNAFNNARVLNIPVGLVNFVYLKINDLNTAKDNVLFNIESTAITIDINTIKTNNTTGLFNLATNTPVNLNIGSISNINNGTIVSINQTAQTVEPINITIDNVKTQGLIYTIASFNGSVININSEYLETSGPEIIQQVGGYVKYNIETAISTSTLNDQNYYLLDFSNEFGTRGISKVIYNGNLLEGQSDKIYGIVVGSPSEQQIIYNININHINIGNPNTTDATIIGGILTSYSLLNSYNELSSFKVIQAFTRTRYAIYIVSDNSQYLIISGTYRAISGINTGNLAFFIEGNSIIGPSFNNVVAVVRNDSSFFIDASTPADISVQNILNSNKIISPNITNNVTGSTILTDANII